MDRGYSFYGEVRLGHSFILAILLRLGNWPHMLDNGPHQSPQDVLSLGTFCLWDVLSVGRFVLGMFCLLGRSVPWDVLSLGLFVPWDVWSLGTFCLGTFCMCIIFGSSIIIWSHSDPAKIFTTDRIWIRSFWIIKAIFLVEQPIRIKIEICERILSFCEHAFFNAKCLFPFPTVYLNIKVIF